MGWSRKTTTAANYRRRRSDLRMMEMMEMIMCEEWWTYSIMVWNWVAAFGFGTGLLLVIVRPLALWFMITAPP